MKVFAIICLALLGLVPAFGQANMAGSISTLEIPLAQLQSFTHEGTTYFYTHQTMHRPYTVVYCEFVDNKFVMYLMHTYIQSFEIVDFVFFFDKGPIDVSWRHVGSYPFRNTKSNSKFKNDKKVTHVFKAFGIQPPTITLEAKDEQPKNSD